MGKINDLTGQRFGRLAVVERAGRNARRHATWLCRCDCGNSSIVAGTDLLSGNTKSCGCYHDDVSRVLRTKHGAYGKKLYYVWSSMKMRCINPKNKAYKNYGARGVTVCDEWLHSFEVFQRWALVNGYEDGLSLDRIDNNAGYNPSNCRWVTRDVQNNNRRDNRLVEYDGQVRTVAEWARITGLPYEALRRRIAKGEPPEKALGPLRR